MSKRFPNIPAPGNDLNPSVSALVDVVGFITAQTQGEISPLPSEAALAEIVEKVNEILYRLQGRVP